MKDAHPRMALATESGGVGVWDWDLRIGSIEVDATLCQLFGMPLQARVPQAGLHLHRVHPQDRASARARVVAALRSDKPLDCAFRIVRDDGSERFLRTAARVIRDAAGRAVRKIGVNWDVTEQLSLADRLAEQAALPRITLRLIGDAVLTTDVQGCIEWLNPVAERITGWLNAEARGRPSAQVFHIVQEASRQAAIDPVATCLAKGEVVGLADQTVLISRHGIEYGIKRQPRRRLGQPEPGNDLQQGVDLLQLRHRGHRQDLLLRRHHLRHRHRAGHLRRKDFYTPRHRLGEWTQTH